MADDATINSNLPSDGQRTRPFGWLHVAEISFASIHHRPATVAVFVSIFPNLTKDQAMTFDSPPVKFKPYTRQTISQAPQWQHLPESLREAVQVVSRVMPFRTNQYVMDELIDWGKVPDDPIYRLTFPHQDMLSPADYSKLRDLVLVKKDEAAIEETVRGIRLAMNPHPAGQMTHNVPFMNGQPVSGLQHKYKETVLFFPSAGQTCHAYCTFCSAGRSSWAWTTSSSTLANRASSLRTSSCIPR
ncbi:hypothetical protein QFZ96_001116 [Paraburkholderia youngii]